MSIFQTIGSFIGGIFLAIGSLFVSSPAPTPSVEPTVAVPVTESATTPPDTSVQPSDAPSAVAAAKLASGQTAYTDAQLLAMADNTYASGEVPLGDKKYVTSAAKKGYVYLCHIQSSNQGAQAQGPWIHGTTWNFLSKISIDGSVSWPTASFSNIISGANRVLTGNGLPTTHTTGTFPIASGSAAAAYDRNPNSIKSQTLKDSLPANPVYSETPYCMGGEVGVMLSGVPLFNGFDAPLRDAAANELQDSCGGHPQESGQYHYHSLSPCFKDISEKTVLGYAYDGFPITGPLMAPKKYLTTDDLDVCHGITSAITVDGKSVTTYHYVMTQDFPYSASCFRGKPITTGPSGGTPGGQSGQQGSMQGGGQSGPPQAAIDACSGKSTNASCTVQTPNGTLSGTCKTPPNASLACVPN